jgi:hypothetical protein
VRTTDPKIGDLVVPGEVAKAYHEPVRRFVHAVRPNEDRDKPLTELTSP